QARCTSREKREQDPETYRIGSDTVCLVNPSLLLAARTDADLSIAELARRAGTSRPSVSAYEHGRVTPTLDTFERLLAATANRLTVTPMVKWSQVPVGRGRVAFVPDRLPDLSATQALRTFRLPMHLDWSSPTREIRLSD